MHTIHKIYVTGILVAAIFLPSCNDQDSAEQAFNKGNYAQAYHLWKPLAKEGDLDAQNYLGICHYLGLGGLRDLEKAKNWFARAAEQGHASAQYNLANMYENGETVAQDFVVAYMWFYIAEQQGHERAKGRIKHLLDDLKLFPNQMEHAHKLAEPYLKKSNVSL